MNPQPPRRAFTVVPYDPGWPRQFCQLRDRIWPAVSHIAAAIEHVGSTSIPGMAAKPVIDIDVVIRSPNGLPTAISALESLGYEHRGDLGIPDREAFRALDDRPSHNLYVCPAGSIALHNHLTLRDHLRDHPDDAASYSRLKLRLAEIFPDDMDHYVEAKSEFILSILAQHGFPASHLESIRRANKVRMPK